MPGVTVQHRNNGVMNEGIKAIIRSVVCRFGVERFSTKKIQLKEGDFTITFHEAESTDQLSRDIIVCIPLHRTKKRTKDSDGLGTDLAKALRKALKKSGVKEGTTVGARIPISEIGWGEATV